MSFLRHGESLDPMISLPLGASSCAHSQRSSAAMSSSRLFLGRLLSSRAYLRFAGCKRFSKTEPRRTMLFQRTATTPLTSCLSPGCSPLSFLLPLMEKRGAHHVPSVRAVILVPTRELAMQVRTQYDDFRYGKLPCTALVIGRMPERPQLEALGKGEP